MSNLTTVSTPEEWQQVTITTKQSHIDDITHWLQLKGAVSITISDNGDEPIYEPQVNETPFWQHIKIYALFESKYDINKLINQLTYDFSKDIIEQYEHHIIEYDRSKQHFDFEPVCLAEKLWIYPYGKHPSEQRYYINLEPGLAFGSGEHPTTSLCLEWLADNMAELQDSHIMDFGCGSGILAIAAIKLGAKHAIAIDNDPQAIVATNDNALRNNISDKITTYFPNDVPEKHETQVDYILANILANPLIELCDDLISHLKPGGKIILSGILQEQTDHVALAYMNHGITLLEIKNKGAWVRIVGEK